VTFPLAFAAHDLEQVLAAARWSENAAARLTRRPRLGRALAAALPISTQGDGHRRRRRRHGAWAV